MNGEAIRTKGSACELCPRNFSCTNIKAAMEIIQRHLEENDSDEIHQRYQGMLDSLEALGVSFPNGEKLCDLAHDKEAALKLINEGIAILRDLEREHHQGHEANKKSTA